MTRPSFRWPYFAPTTRLRPRSYSKPISHSSMYCPFRSGSAGVASTQERLRTRSCRILQVVGGVGAEVVAEALDLAAERADVDVHRDALEEAAPVRIQLAAVVPRDIPDEADARRPVVLQIERGLLIAVANVLPFPADSGVHRKSARQLSTSLARRTTCCTSPAPT